MFAKMKKMTACALAACALCLALAPGIAWAGEAPGVVLDEGASNGSVDVSLVVPKGGDEVRALKLSLTVKGEGGEALEAGFGFSKAVEGAAVAQVRFKPVDGGQRVNLYVAVKDGNLFSGDRLDLGTLALSSSSDSVAEVSVSSLEVVSSSHVEMDEKQLGMELPAPLSVKVASGSSVGPDEPVSYTHLDPKLGELVGAFVRVRPGYEDMTEDDVRAFAIPRIARYKVPKRVFFVDDFPMTPSMKVQKFKLREMAEELVRAGK